MKCAKATMASEPKGGHGRVVVTWNEVYIRLINVLRDQPFKFLVRDSQGHPRVATPEEIEAITDKLAPLIEPNKFLREYGVLADWEEVEDKPPPDWSG